MPALPEAAEEDRSHRHRRHHHHRHHSGHSVRRRRRDFLLKLTISVMMITIAMAMWWFVVSNQ